MHVSKLGVSWLIGSWNNYFLVILFTIPCLMKLTYFQHRYIPLHGFRSQCEKLAHFPRPERSQRTCFGGYGRADAGEHTWVDRGHRPVDAQVINRGISCMLQVGWFVRMLCCVIAKMLENSIPVPHSQKMISLWKGAIFINHPTTVLGPSEFGLELSRAKRRRLSVSGRFGCFSKTRYPSILWTLSDGRNPCVFLSALWETANFEVFEVQ